MSPAGSFCHRTAVLAGMLALAGPGAPARAQAAFTASDAVRAEWERQPPVLSPAVRAARPPADLARWERTLRRIGAPGAPALLPPWLETPAREDWEARAKAARTPRERFTALHFLNRLKSPLALSALEGLAPGDAAAWPSHLHLEGAVATARIQGCAVPAAVQAFLDEYRRAGRADPVRTAAARIRLVLASLEPGPAKLPDASSLAYLDAWNKGPWERRATAHLAALAGAVAAPFNPGPAQRLLLGLPPGPLPEADPLLLKALKSDLALVRGAALEHLLTLTALEPDLLAEVQAGALRTYGGPLGQPYLAVLRKFAPAAAGRYGAFLLGLDDPTAIAAALDDLAQPPADLEPLVARLWKASQYDAVQSFLPALERWRLPEARRVALLKRFLDHPCWTARLDAYRLLAKVDPATPWPAPAGPGLHGAAILEEALRLARAPAPVRLRITFQGAGAIVLKLDPANAPINVANLVLLARQGFFDGLSVPRVVPDFVVQMGSPSNSMDGGPGYTVPCEDSLDFYGPGSVGMALSGKDTGGSQFFITTNAAPHLTGRYTRVGELEDPDQALPILDRLELATVIERIEVL